MSKVKLYFPDFEEDEAHSIDYIIEEMKERELTECKVAIAVKDDDKSYFFCKMVEEVCVKPPEGEACGKECDSYKPRNGKSGCCIHRGFCYVPGPEFSLSISGKLSSIPVEDYQFT